MDEILERIGLEERVIREIFANNGLVYDADELLRTIEKLQRSLKFDDSAILMMLTKRPDLIARKASVNGIFNVQYSFNLPRPELSAMMASNGIYRFEPEEEYLKRIHLEAGLTLKEMNGLIQHSRVAQKRPSSENIVRDIQILESLGLNRSRLYRSASVLVLSPIHLIDVLKLGMLYYGDEDISGFLYYNRHRQDRNRVYARMMAERNGEIPVGLAYLSDGEFFEASQGVSDVQLLSKYKLTPESRMDLDDELAIRFPRSAEILEAFEAQEIVKLIDQSSIDVRESSTGFEANNRVILEERGRLTKPEIDLLIKREPKLLTVDTSLLMHNINSLAYLVGKSNVKVMMIAKPSYLVDNENMICDCFSDLRESSGITRAQLGNALLDLARESLEHASNTEADELDS